MGRDTLGMWVLGWYDTLRGQRWCTGGLGRFSAGSGNWSWSLSYFPVILPRLTCTLSGLFTRLSPQGHVGDALPPEMVTRLFEGMRRVDGSGKAKGPSERISHEQFTASMSHMLKGTAEEKSLVILNMISASGGPVKARDVHKVRGHQALLSHPRQCWCPLVGGSG